MRVHLRDRTILVASSEPWDFLPLSKHHVAAELARDNDVLFLNPPRGLRTRRVPLRQSHLARLRVLDVFCPGFAGERVLTALLRRRLRDVAPPTVAIAFHPAFHHLRRLLPRAALVYFANDAVHGRYLRDERRMLVAADLVVAGSRALQCRLAPHHPRVAYLPLAVNVGALAGARVERPIDLPPSPVAGLIGTIADQIDYQLLHDVARARRHVAFALIGPYHPRRHGGSGCPRRWRKRLAAEPNVHLLGPREHHEIGSYLRHVDVALLPYALAQSHCKAPLKVLEAFVFGKAVVATRVPELARHGDLVLAADDASSFAAQVDAALCERDPSLSARRRATARAWTWTSVVDRLDALLARQESARS